MYGALSMKWLRLIEYTYVLEVVERVEDTEDIETALDSLARELVDGIVPETPVQRELPRSCQNTHG